MSLASIYVPATSQHERQFVSFCAGSQLYVWCRQKGKGEGDWAGLGERGECVCRHLIGLVLV